MMPRYVTGDDWVTALGEQETMLMSNDDQWKHRSANMKCATCMWFVSKQPSNPYKTEQATQLGRCRRHAPSMNGFPAVFLADWCGDHKLDENKL